MQVLGRLDAVPGAGGLLAPALSGAVVGADPGGLCDGAGDPRPGRGDSAEPVGEHDGGGTLAAAVQVQPVAANVVQLPRGGDGGLVAGARDVVVGGADRGQDQHRDHGGEHPARLPGHRAAHLDEHPPRERHHQRRPHPVQRGQSLVTGGEDHQGGPGGAHGDRRDDRPPLWLLGAVHGQRGHQRPTEPEPEQQGPGDGGLGAAGEHDEDQHQRGDGAREDGADDGAPGGATLGSGLRLSRACGASAWWGGSGCSWWSPCWAGEYCCRA